MARLPHAAIRRFPPWPEYAPRLRDFFGDVGTAASPSPSPARLDGETARAGLIGALTMKILQLTRQFLPSEGGIESVVEGLSCALQQKGHTERVATLRSVLATDALAPAESVES